LIPRLHPTPKLPTGPQPAPAPAPRARTRVHLLLLGAALLSQTARAQAVPSAAPQAEPPPALETAGPPPSERPVELPVYRSVATSQRTPARDPAQDSQRVDGQRLRESAKGSTFEALAQEAPGLYVPARGALHGVAAGGSGGLHLRGLGGSPTTQVLVLADGVPDTQGIFGHPLADAHVPALVDEVLLLQGGDSVLYGSNAMGGVLEIRSRWPERAGWVLDADQAWGSFDTVRSSLSVLADTASGEWVGALSSLSSAGHRPGAGGELRLGQIAWRGRLGQALSLSLRNKLLHLEGADPGPASHPNPDHWFDVWREEASAQLAWRAAGTRATVTPHLHLGVHRLYDGFWSRDTVLGLRGEVALRPLRRWRTLFGLAGEQLRGELEDRTGDPLPQPAPQSEAAAYHQSEVWLLPSLRALVGGRAVASDPYGWTLLYKAGAVWDLPWGFALQGRVARNYRRPTLRELYLPFPTANPDLRPELATCRDLGLRWAGALGSVALTAYSTSLRDQIKTFGTWPSAEVVNIDRAELRGLEARAEFGPLGPLRLRVGGDARDVGRLSRQNPTAKLNGSLALRGPLGPGIASGELGGQWVHGLYMANYQREPLADVFVLDLSLRYEWQQAPGRPRVYLHLRNLLDRPYAYVAEYPMPGLDALAGLELEI